MQLRTPRSLLIPLLVFGTLTAGCQRGSDPNLTAENQRLKSELEDARLRIDGLENAVATKRADVAIATAPATVKDRAPEPEAVDNQKDQQILALQTELAELKKRDAFIYAEISAASAKVSAAAALERYEKFMKDFPKSPLAADADRAIAELTPTAQREARADAILADPRRATRNVLEHFTDGTVTVQEIAPLLKNRSAASVVKLLGPPNQTYRDGKEIGYVDNVIDSVTGNKGTLVIGFDSDTVNTLRVGYLGKPIKL
jgi:hypothetical protein